MAELGEGLSGYLDVQDATLRAPRLEAVSNIGIANTAPRHAFSVGSNLYVSTDSSNVLTVNGNVACEGIKMGLIEITPSYDLAAVSNVGNVTSNTLQFSNATTGFVTTSNVEIGGGAIFSGHILPSADNTYDIGSAAFKIRDMYVSDNSLWIGDDTKLSVTGGELKFRKRNTGVVPKGITDMGGTGSAALTHAGVSDINDMKLHHWEAYAKSIDAAKTTKDIFTDDVENYETSAIKTFNTSNAMTIGTTKTFVVTVSDASGANKYYIDGIQQPYLTLHQHQTYIFDLSSPTLVDHPFIFSGTADGIAYTTGITTTGAYGSTEKRTFIVPAGAPATLYYYCTAHVGMGATVSISSEAELIVSGRFESTGTGGISLGGGTTAQRPTYAPLGTIRYNTETGYMESYTVSGWGALATPPSIVSISPLVVAVADTATQVFTVSGASFDAGLAINLVGADGTEYEVVDTTFVNAATTTFKMGDLSSATAQLANRPYKVKVTGGSGLATTSIQTIGFSGISWTSPASGATLDYVSVASGSTNLVATDEVGGSDVTFSIISGSVSGLGLNSQTSSPATYSGTASSGGTTSVTFRVTDNVTESTADRTFSIVVTVPPAPGQHLVSGGYQYWTVPTGVTDVSVCCIGNGSGTDQWDASQFGPGVGSGAVTLKAGHGGAGASRAAGGAGGAGGTPSGHDGGGNGGSGGNGAGPNANGAGAGGYGGNGGNGGTGSGHCGQNGGGTGIYGGTGSGGGAGNNVGVYGGSKGTPASGGSGRTYGASSGRCDGGNDGARGAGALAWKTTMTLNPGASMFINAGGNGAVRIIWGYVNGVRRSYPNTYTADY